MAEFCIENGVSPLYSLRKSEEAEENMIKFIWNYFEEKQLQNFDVFRQIMERVDEYAKGLQENLFKDIQAYNEAFHVYADHTSPDDLSDFRDSYASDY